MLNIIVMRIFQNSLEHFKNKKLDKLCQYFLLEGFVLLNKIFNPRKILIKVNIWNIIKENHRYNLNFMSHF